MDAIVGLLFFAGGAALGGGMVARHGPAAVRSARRARGDTPSSDTAEQTALLHALLHETMDASVLVVAAGSIANALAANRPEARRTSLAAYLPAEPLIAVKAIQRLDTLPQSLVDALIAFHTRAALARRLSAELAREPDDASGWIAAPLASLAQIWRGTAADVLGLMYEIEPILLAKGMRAPGDRRPERLRALLADVTAGGWPSLDEDGFVTVPGWAERRRAGRQELSLAATLSYGEGVCRIVVRDASLGGLGIEGAPDLAPGTSVVVTLDNGTELLGSIAWSKEQRSGVNLFDQGASLANRLARCSEQPQAAKR